MAEQAQLDRTITAEGPPRFAAGPLGWVRARLFNTWYNTVVTVLIVWALAAILPDLVDWLVVDAVWGAAAPEVCREAGGACWAFVHEKARLILFGLYPYDQQWRPVLAVLLLVGLIAVSTNRAFWRPWLAALWVVGTAAIFVLMGGGVVPLPTALLFLDALAIVAYLGWLGRLKERSPTHRAAARLLLALVLVLTVLLLLPLALRLAALVQRLGAHFGLPVGAALDPDLRLLDGWGIPTGLVDVPNTLWGGLPLTLGLSVIGLAVAFPLGIVLALGRRSTMPAIRTICVTYIELIRGVPLITVLFMASVMFPLFLPAGVTVDKLLRAQVGFILFAAAYLAEVVRGGLQAVPRGQYEAANSLGLAYWQATGLIILPQALRISIPPLVNTFIGFFKDTSLVIIIGLFDLLASTKAAVQDPPWRSFYREGYLFVGLIYFVFCYSMSRYSQGLERRVNVGTRRQGRR